MSDYKILGYGEDALTLGMLQQRGDELCEKLREEVMDAREKVQVVWYRPSFGRGQFGEFDAIIETDRQMVLIESKRSESSECKYQKGVVSLRAEQWMRHAIVGYLFREWKQADTWDQFALKCAGEFKRIFEKSLPQTPKSKSEKDVTLIRNLNTVFNNKARKKKLRNVVLIFKTKAKKRDGRAKEIVECVCETSRKDEKTKRRIEVSRFLKAELKEMEKFSLISCDYFCGKEWIKLDPEGAS